MHENVTKIVIFSYNGSKKIVDTFLFFFHADAYVECRIASLHNFYKRDVVIESTQKPDSYRYHMGNVAV